MTANEGPQEEALDRGEFYPKVKSWVVQGFGQEVYKKYALTLPPRIVERFESADQAAWFPVEDSRLVYESIVSFFGDEQLENFVKFYVNLAISGFLRGLVIFLRPLDLAKRALALWKRFHTTGRPEIEIVSKNHGVITLHDWNYSPIHCRVHNYWFKELVRIAGGKDINVAETHCVHSGDSFCRWEVTFG